jgi:diguanylate cyclase (GGDEF)-like protein
MTINRVTMLPVLREQQELARRQAQSSCVVMVDIDHFKRINDKYGHLVGDKVLASLAKTLTANLRPYDKIFRYGGEEFLLSIQQVNVQQAYEMIDRLREIIADMEIDVGMEQRLKITVSCGITSLDPDSTVEQSIDHADKALYVAKSSGRNNTQCWQAGMSTDRI